MELKQCSRCYIEKSLEEFYRDSSKADKLTSACRKCRNTQTSRARKVRALRAQGKVLEERPELLEHNLETLQRIVNREECPKSFTLTTQLVECPRSFKEGIVFHNEMAYIETLEGTVSKDLRRNTLKALARFLENERIKIIDVTYPKGSIK